ncbi:MAG: hypothetical protein R3A79_29715 [Nannocystaceae bacterium]
MHSIRLPWTLSLLLCAAAACSGSDNEGNSDASTSETSTATSGATEGGSAGSTSATDGSTSATATSDSSATGETGTATDATSTTNTTATTATTDSTGTTDSGGDGFSFCAEICADDSDCTIDGEDQGLTCQDGVCAGQTSGWCSSDQECRDLFSGWDQGDPCNAQADCAITQGCIDLNGAGRCVFIPSDFIQCEDLQMSEVEVPAIEGGTILVCGNTTAICTEDEYCINACQSNADCLSANFPVCNGDTGLCECGQDSDCAGITGASVCIDGACRCGADADCDDIPNADVCNDGICGCSGLRVCQGVDQTFDGTEIACKDFG